MITDDMLYKSAAIAHEALLAATHTDTEPEHVFSRRFERKMRKLIRHTKYPVVYSVIKFAACFLLVSILTAAMFLTANVKAREAFFKWVKEKYEYFIEYYFDGMVSDEVIEDNAMAEYRLGWVPEGYVEGEVRSTLSNTYITYNHPANPFIAFSYRINPNASDIQFYEHNLYTYSQATINGIIADIYVSNNTDEANTIIWINNDTNTLFYISAYINKVDLIEMAKNVIKLDSK